MIGGFRIKRFASGVKKLVKRSKQAGGNHPAKMSSTDFPPMS